MANTTNAITSTINAYNNNQAYANAAGNTVASGQAAYNANNDWDIAIGYIPVFLVPVGSPNKFNASVMISAVPSSYDWNGTPGPIEGTLLPGGITKSQIVGSPTTITTSNQLQIDNGNVNEGRIIDIKNPLVAVNMDPPFQIISSISFDIDGNNVPSNIRSQWPDVYSSTNLSNPSLTHYYITHNTISISGTYALGSFQYR